MSGKEGFFDLSIKPDSLTEKEYQKILSIQEYLKEENVKKEIIRKTNPKHWEELKNLSARLQQIVLQHWNINFI